MWVNMAEAYNRLPSHIKQQIAGLRARHSIEGSERRCRSRSAWH